MVVYVHDKTNLTKVKDLPLDLSVVKSSGILNNSALKSRIHLNNKRKHQPSGKRIRGNIKLLFLRKRSAPTTASTQSPTSSPAVVSFPSSKFYSLPESNSQTQQDFQTSVVANKKPLVTNTASLQMISEVTESYSNDNDFAEKTVLSKNDQQSIEAKLMDMHHDFSFVKSSRLLDNSALKDRINLSKKRKHRPPGERKDENTKEKFLIKHVCQPSASKSHQTRPSSHASVFSFSAFYNIPCSKSKDFQTHEDSQTTVLGKEKTLVRNAAALSTILEVPESSSNDNDKAQLRDVPYDFSLVKVFLPLFYKVIRAARRLCSEVSNQFSQKKKTLTTRKKKR
ncbi:uncharacterized protein si:dkey-9i23.6 isoform X1 [Silurus meridionalis]|uniref:uncharacterized protein si:dkey-9i23.6 isoform X1 n=1 Tax=Silurus meridionalis TaxID=175797 RepID=UPI001EECD4C5|nr:uncharacterized protein si:dkey-9i23.6 isoform X1 [Silurus meridionalis]